MAPWSDPVTLESTAPNRTRPGKAAALREEVFSPDLSFLMEAHSGLSAKIVEEAGFRGVWASGLTISASLGLRDSNEASWTQVLDLVEYMVDATSLPAPHEHVERLAEESRQPDRGNGGVSDRFGVPDPVHWDFWPPLQLVLDAHHVAGEQLCR